MTVSKEVGESSPVGIVAKHIIKSWSLGIHEARWRRAVLNEISTSTSDHEGR